MGERTRWTVSKDQHLRLSTGFSIHMWTHIIQMHLYTFSFMYANTCIAGHKHFGSEIAKEVIMIRLFLYFSYRKASRIMPILNHRTIKDYSKRIEGAELLSL